MAYIKIADRNLKMIKVSFISKDVNVNKMVREDRVERFRTNILHKYGLQRTKYKHVIKESY